MATTERKTQPDVAAPFRIFLNYRREDAAGHAGRLWDALRDGVESQPGFGEEQIFMDIDTIEPGVDFREAIRKAVEASDVFLALIGKDWLTATDSRGRRRLENPADFVRVEIEAALERAEEHHDVRVVPTRVQGADMPGIEELPAGIAGLAHRNAVELTDERWRYDVGRLIASLKQLERAKTERARAEREAAERERREREAEEEAAARKADLAAREELKRDASTQAGKERAREALPREVSPPQPAERLPRERPAFREAEDERRRRVRKQVAAGAILIAVVAGVALLIALLASGGESSNAPPPPPDNGTELPPREGRLAWERAAGTGLGGNGAQAMTSIVGTAQGGLAFVAGGYSTAAGTLDGSIWTSTDGLAWQSVPSGQGFEGAGNQKITTVADFGGALVAAGTDDSGGDLDIALWRSTDGVHWDTVGGLAAPGTGEAISRVTNISRRELVAAGSQTGGGNEGEDAAVWVFGTTLEPVAPVSDADFGGPGNQRISRVVKLDRPEGKRLVALGFDDGDAGVWTSDDGRAWDRVAAEALGGDGDREILDATVLGSTVVAVGTEVVNGEERGAAWLSEDGRRWTRASDPKDVLAAPVPVKLNRVLDLGQGLVAEGFPALVAGGSAGGKTAVWTSDDGLVWAREADSSNGLGRRGEINSFRADSRSVIAVGAGGRANRLDAVILIGAPSG